MKTIWFLLCLALLATPAFAAAPQTLEAGFSWVAFEPGKMRLQKPDGWFVKAESDALFISRENIDEAGSFKVGLSVNVLSDVRERTGLQSSEYAKRVLAGMVEGHTVLASDQSELTGGKFGLTLRVRADTPDPLIVHYLLIADDRADRLSVFSFEAPVSEWVEAWKLGAVMLGRRIDE